MPVVYIHLSHLARREDKGSLAFNADDMTSSSRDMLRAQSAPRRLYVTSKRDQPATLYARKKKKKKKERN